MNLCSRTRRCNSFNSSTITRPALSSLLDVPLSEKVLVFVSEMVCRHSFVGLSRGGREVGDRSGRQTRKAHRSNWGRRYTSSTAVRQSRDRCRRLFFRAFLVGQLARSDSERMGVLTHLLVCYERGREVSTAPSDETEGLTTSIELKWSSLHFNRQTTTARERTAEF